MTRSIYKGPFISNSLFKKLNATDLNEVVLTWSRASTILPMFVGRKVDVYNGKQFYSLVVTPDMIGHKFGEFVRTKKVCVYKKNKKKQKKNFKK